MLGTIAALASPPGASPRGILRISGSDARAVLEASLSAPIPMERAVLPCTFDDGVGVLPVTLFWMPAPHSYTCEDVAELHLPGNPFLLDRALERVLGLGVRAAAPGEFTRRAFLNGRIDLTRAEGVLELVQAVNEGERRAATRLLAGGLERRVDALRERLDDVRALVEASLDFDEADTGHVPEAELLQGLAAIQERLSEALGWEVRRQAPTALPRVLLFGGPNAGKSSLFNALGDGRAIVSDLPGTTRDTLAGLWSLAHGPCLLLDVPGLDPRARGPDAIGQHLAGAERASADLVVWVIDGTGCAPRDLAAEERLLPAGVPVVVAWNKVDLDPVGNPPRFGVGEVVALSARTRIGLEELARVVERGLGLAPEKGGRAAPETGLARELFARHRGALEQAVARAGEAADGLRSGVALDLVAEALRAAARELDQITGRSSPEDLLDRIFARFCIGK